jgi:hypothetical protein
MNLEKLIFVPLEAARKVGQVVLWATERAIPMEERTRQQIGASITYYSTPEACPRCNGGGPNWPED